MSFITAFNSILGFTRLAGNYPRNHTSSSELDTIYVDSCIEILGNSVTRLTVDLPSPKTTLWVHFEYDTNASIASHDLPMIWIGGGTTDLFRISVTNGDYQFQYWDGSTWVNVGSPLAIAAFALTRHDILIVMENSAGTIEWYANETLQASYYNDTIWTAETDIEYVAFGGVVANGSGFLSQVILADESTLGCKLFQHAITADGANTGFTGGFADYTMSARSIPQTSSAAYTSTDGAVETGIVSDLLSTSLFIRGVQVNVAARKSGGPVQKANAVIRSGGTNYFSDDVLLGFGNTTVSKLWDTDPATGVSWTSSGVNAIEAGMRAKA